MKANEPQSRRMHQAHMVRRQRDNYIAALLCFFSMANLTSCATVTFYKDEKLTEITGLRYFAPKPYLLVSRTGTEANPVQISIQYLPDFTKPTYAKFMSGMGSHNFSVALSNGMLSTYGQSGDTKLTELLGSVAEIMTANAARISAKATEVGAKTEPTLAKVADKTADQCPEVDDLSKFAPRLTEIATSFYTDLLVRVNKEKYPVKPMRDRLIDLGKRLNMEAQTLKSSVGRAESEWRATCATTVDSLRSIVKDWSSVRLDMPDTKEGQVITKNFETLRLEVVEFADSMVPPKPAITKDFEFYEINLEGNRTILTPAAIRK